MSNNSHHHKRGSFTGSLGFVMAAAGSAVGLGNIWRFPYLAAKNGGGTFIFVYIILALTFGFTLLITEISMGRKTKQGPLTAYGMLNKKFAPTGFLGACHHSALLLHHRWMGTQVSVRIPHRRRCKCCSRRLFYRSYYQPVVTDHLDDHLHGIDRICCNQWC